MRLKLPFLVLTTIFSASSYGNDVTEEIFPTDLYPELSQNVAIAAKEKNGEAWLGGSGIDRTTGKRVGLVLWGSDQNTSDNYSGLVVSCFEESASELPEIVVYRGVTTTGRAVQATFQYDDKQEQSETWAILDEQRGGLYIVQNGDVHTRNMRASNQLLVSTPIGEPQTYSLAGFTKEFSKACSWHQGYNKWIASSATQAPASTIATSNEKSSIENEIQAIAEREYPDDKQLQKFVYGKQLSAYNYLQKVTDAEALEFATQEYPSDYSLQKFVYDKQVAAKKYMSTEDDSEVKEFSIGEYPRDFSLQKFVYDKQAGAKKYMGTVDDAEVKEFAIGEYPRDFSLQKFVYEKQLAAKKYMATADNQAAKAEAIGEYPRDYSLQKFVYEKIAF